MRQEAQGQAGRQERKEEAMRIHIPLRPVLLLLLVGLLLAGVPVGASAAEPQFGIASFQTLQLR